MPDAPDYFAYRLESERNALGDMAELAVRLGSPVTYDRIGDVVWSDDFACGLSRWCTVAGAGGSSVKVDASLAYWSGFTAKLYAAAAVGNGAAIYKYLSVPRVNKWGLEVSVAFTSVFDRFIMQFIHVTPDTFYEPAIKVNYTTQKIQYLGADLAYHNIGALSEQASAYGLYHHLKMVVDFENLEYVKLRQDENLYDLSGIAVPTEALADVPMSQVHLGLYSDNTNAATARVGSVIVTANEP